LYNFPFVDYLSAPKKRMMIQRLLLAAIIMLSGSAASAQYFAPDYRYNIGIYGGIAPTTRIYRTVDYTGDERAYRALLASLAT
jgi:hypothetical protein